jgi:hypothetical protein
VGQQFFHNEARVRICLAPASSPVLFAMNKQMVGGLAVGATVKIREATRDGQVFAVKITSIGDDDHGKFFSAARV